MTGNNGLLSANCFDVGATLDNLGGDIELLQQLGTLFVAGVEGYARELMHALDAGDAGALGRAAHQIKGSAGIFMGCAAAVDAAALEQECKTGMPADAAAKVDRMLGMVRELSRTLRAWPPG